MKFLKKIILLLFFLNFTLIACTSTKTNAQKNFNTEFYEETITLAKNENTTESQDFLKIDKFFKNKNYQQVIKESQNFLKRYPNSNYKAQVYHLKGTSELNLKQMKQAIFSFQEAIETLKKSRNYNPTFISMEYFNLALAYYELSNHEQALKALLSIEESALSTDNQAKVHILKAKNFKALSYYEKSLDEILYAIEKLQLDSKSQQTYFNFITHLLEQIETKKNSIQILEKISNQHSNAKGNDLILFKLANLHLKNGSKEPAKLALEKLIAQHADSIYYTQAKDLLNITEAKSKEDASKIGVILTLSGKYGKVGQRSLQAIEMAFGIFDSNQKNNATLVVYDDEGLEEKAENAMNELYFKHNVIAIIGPVLSKLVEPSARKAELLQIPLLTLTQKEYQKKSQESFVFSLGLTPSMQSSELIEIAKNLGITSYGIIGPNSNFGKEHIKAFWDTLDSKNLQVRAYETYSEDETDFRNVIDSMVGLNATQARLDEITQINNLKNTVQNQLKFKSKKFLKMFQLKPIIDFQAVFIPDEPKNLGQILPTFAYRDVDKIQFLGINTWNSLELAVRAGNFAEGSIFVDGFFAESKKDKIQNFISRYKDLFKTNPTLIESVAFDAAKIADYIAPIASTRIAFRDYLNQLNGFNGLIGPIKVENGKVFKTLHHLTLKGGKIVELDR
jgi:ABC-type branched-subunit amino acid transport system substrate-binding protein